MCNSFFSFAFSLHVGTSPNCFPDEETVLSFFFYVLKLSALARRVKWPVYLAIMIFQPRPQPAMAQRAGRVSNEIDKQRADGGTRRALDRVSV